MAQAVTVKVSRDYMGQRLANYLLAYQAELEVELAGCKWIVEHEAHHVDDKEYEQRRLGRLQAQLDYISHRLYGLKVGDDD